MAESEPVGAPEVWTLMAAVNKEMAAGRAVVEDPTLVTEFVFTTEPAPVFRPPNFLHREHRGLGAVAENTVEAAGAADTPSGRGGD